MDLIDLSTVVDKQNENCVIVTGKVNYSEFCILFIFLTIEQNLQLDSSGISIFLV